MGTGKMDISPLALPQSLSVGFRVESAHLTGVWEGRCGHGAWGA